MCIYIYINCISQKNLINILDDNHYLFMYARIRDFNPCFKDVFTANKARLQEY